MPAPGNPPGEALLWWKVAMHLDEAVLALPNAIAHNLDDQAMPLALQDRLREAQAILLEIFRAKHLLPDQVAAPPAGPSSQPSPPMPPMPPPPPPSAPPSAEDPQAEVSSVEAGEVGEAGEAEPGAIVVEEVPVVAASQAPSGTNGAPPPEIVAPSAPSPESESEA